jgi:hypothetical protein
MRRAASAAPKLLREAAPEVLRFVQGRAHAGGGFTGRSAASDLYYTVFGVACVEALGAAPSAERLAPYLRSFGAGESLDFVHLCCLARLWGQVGGAIEPSVRARMLERIERFRAPDGGYAERPGASAATAYANFLAVGAHEDLGSEVPGLERLLESMDGLRAAGGGYANLRGVGGATAATAAAVTVLVDLGRPVDPVVGAWLLAQCRPEGGFLAMPGAPLPDLLSTATALHALGAAGVSIDAIRAPCIDFVESLRSAEGGFRGHRADRTPDCEYTFYGLLALGNLVS